MNEKWTPGPWVYKEDCDNFVAYATHSEKESFGGAIMADGMHVARIWSDVSDDGEHVYNAKLIESAPALYTVLSTVEWAQDQESGRMFCPYCYGYKTDGHNHNCELNAVLKMARGEK